MGFLQMIKDKLGIGGVSVKLDVPGQAGKADEKLEGKLLLSSKSDQEVVSCTIKLIEEFTTGRGDDETTKEYDLGKVVISEGFTIKSGETKEIAFTLPYKVSKSSLEELSEKGGALGALGKLGSMASSDKSEYFVSAEVDVKSAALDPSDKKAIKLV